MNANDNPLGRTGGVYIPPFKLAMMKKAQEAPKYDLESQRLTWEALRKSINGLINKVNVSNIKHIIPELFEENLVRGRGLFARAIMKAQLASPGFTHIYAAVIAVINTKLPENGELILKRVIYSFKRAYKRRDKIAATALAKFIAHLVNHQVAHELLALQLITVLLEEPTDDSVEIAVNFVKEVGNMLQELSPQGLHAIFERFRGILHEGEIDKRVQYTIEVLFAIRKTNFKDYPAIPTELDIVDREDQITFEIGLDDEVEKEEILDVFRYDPNYEENEKLWTEIKKDILGEDTGSDNENEENASQDNENITDGTLVTQTTDKISDMTEQDLINLRRTLYLTIMSSVSFEECAHKILKLQIPEGYESELCNMFIECCANEKSYLKFYGLLGQRFCMIQKKYQNSFDEAFLQQYTTIHRLETNKLRNVAKFFGHLLATDALPWTCFEYIKLNEDETTSSSRIFIKVLMQDLAEVFGMATLKERFSDEYMHEVFSGMFPLDNPRNTRFAINFYTSVGLGGLTEGLREHLKNAPKLLALQMQQQMSKPEESSESESDSSSSSSSSDSDSESDASDSSSDSSSSSSSSSSGSSSSNESEASKKNISSNPAKFRNYTQSPENENLKTIDGRNVKDIANEFLDSLERERENKQNNGNKRRSRSRSNNRRGRSGSRDDTNYRKENTRRDSESPSRQRRRYSRSRDRNRNRSRDRSSPIRNRNSRSREKARYH